jgi:thioredoxin 1
MVEMIKFGAEWCGPCRMMKPAIASIREKYATDAEVNITDVDVDDNSEMSKEYGVRSIPMIVFLKDNVVSEKKVGVLSATEIERIIENLKTAEVTLGDKITL